jgi:hypothetical protein
LVAALRVEFPQLQLCFSGDALFACGEGFQIARDYNASFMYVFKEGRMPALWAEFQSLLRLCPENCFFVRTDEVDQLYRWVKDLHYIDSNDRKWTFTAIQCEETRANGEKSRWAWVTDLKVNHETVEEVATKGGRHRWHQENQGFNTQKNSGLNLEHAYSHVQWAAYYFLLQIAHMLLQLVEKGSLLRHLAEEQGKRSAVQLYGGLVDMAQRLLESVRYLHWPDEVFALGGKKIQIRLDSS